MRFRTLATVWVLAIGAFGAPSMAHAWGDEGHEIVGLVAQHFLTPAVAARVAALLATDTTALTPGTDIPAEATWADKYRDSDRNTTKVRYGRTHNWHFIDMEIDGPDLHTACFGEPPLPVGTDASMGPSSDCIVDKINEFAAELHASGTSPAERVMALQFLLHFLGDIHQPLHASDDHDQGGNGKTVSATGHATGKLHHYWDTEFVAALGTDAGVVAEALASGVTTAQRTSWSQGVPADWAQESFAVARDVAYGTLPAPLANGHYQLPASYVSAAQSTVREQLSKAGVRLAYVLNRALGSDGAADANAAANVPHDLLWYRTSAEMKASYRQAYRVATDRLPVLSAGLATGTWAVIVDADETILDNSEWALRGFRKDPANPPGTWNDWVLERKAKALPGAKEFIDAVRALGGRVVVVTNRSDAVCQPTRENLLALEISVDGVLCDVVGDRDKNPRFASVAAGTSPLSLPPLTVVAYLGDNIQDFPNKSQAAPGSLDDFGVKYFVLPNPVYGSWDHNPLQ